VVRLLILAGLAYVAVQVVLSNTAELSGAASYLEDARLGWVVAAVGAEIVSYLAFTQLSRHLMAAGNVRTGLIPMYAISLAGNAISTSLPGGGAFASVFAYNQLRRQGADEALSGWTIVAFTAILSVALAVLSAVGLIIAGSDGPVGGLWPAIPVLVLLPGAAMGVLIWPRVLIPVATPVVAWSKRLISYPHADPALVVERIVERLQAVSLSLTSWLMCLAYGLTNWLTDCTCLVLAFWAVGGHVPWRGLLVAYAAAQVATNLPITPGGLGIVEGSLTIALVLFGGVKDQTVAAVLLYRIISFWGALPVGWLAWLGLHMAHRRASPGVIAELEEESP
jgi:uncharacterized protein (TIRG00374 family)